MGAPSKEETRRSLTRYWWILLALIVLFFVVCCAVTHSPVKAQEASHDLERKPSASDQEASGPLEKGATTQSPLCLYGCPEHTHASEEKGLLIHREIYVMRNNAQTKFADWVAYRVTKETIGKSHTRKWKSDPDLSASATLEAPDYKGAHAALHTDRGHQVPLASFSGTSQWRELNYLSNITPQSSPLNQQLWNRLEGKVRKLAREPDVEAVFVVTGLLFEKEMPELPQADEEHEIPSGYFKIVALKKKQILQLAGFIVTQETSGRESHCDHRARVSEIEERSGLDFFMDLPDAAEEKIESQPGKLYSRLGCEDPDRSAPAAQ